MTDDDLMIRIQEGDDSAYNELVQRYYGMLFGFFLRNTRDPHQAEDLSQDTFLRIHSQAWEYIPQGKFKSWMFRIGRNIMIDDVRRQNRDALVHTFQSAQHHDQDQLAQVVEELVLPEDVASMREFSDLLTLCLQDLPPDQRETLTMYYFSGLSLPEIAHILDANLATTKSRLRLAREKLKSALAEHGIKDQEFQTDKY
jgi:RNA polymerase sigma-70 factor (ECF subfamily)